LYANTTASNNTAVGYNAAQANTTGSSTVAVGHHALYAQTTGAANVGVGRSAMEDLTTGADNTAIGHYAGANQTTSSHNTSVGYAAGNAMTTGHSNTTVGKNAGLGITTGFKNTMLGYGAGDTTTVGDYNIIIGSEADTSATNTEHEIVIGSSATGKGSNTFFAAPSSGSVYNVANSTTWNQTSDRRIKKNIVDNNQGLEIINQIRVRNFEYRTLDEIVDFDKPEAAVVETEGIQIGTIAQEIETVLPQIIRTESTGVKQVNTDSMTWYLVNAVKELSAEVEELKQQLNNNEE